MWLPCCGMDCLNCKLSQLLILSKTVLTHFLRATAYMLYIARICHANSVCLSIRPSVTRVLFVKRAERIIEILSLSDRPIISFSTPKVVAQIWRLHPQWGCQIQGGSNFWPICGYISEMVIDRGIVTMENECRMCSIEWCRFRWPWVTPNLSFKVTVQFKDTYTYIYIYSFKKTVDKRNLNRESYIGMHTVNYLGLVQIQIRIYSSGHME